MPLCVGFVARSPERYVAGAGKGVDVVRILDPVRVGERPPEKREEIGNGHVPAEAVGHSPGQEYVAVVVDPVVPLSVVGRIVPVRVAEHGHGIHAVHRLHEGHYVRHGNPVPPGERYQVVGHRSHDCGLDRAEVVSRPHLDEHVDCEPDEYRIHYLVVDGDHLLSRIVYEAHYAVLLWGSQPEHVLRAGEVVLRAVYPVLYVGHQVQVYRVVVQRGIRVLGLRRVERGLGRKHLRVQVRGRGRRGARPVDLREVLLLRSGVRILRILVRGLQLHVIRSLESRKRIDHREHVEFRKEVLVVRGVCQHEAPGCVRGEPPGHLYVLPVRPEKYLGCGREVVYGVEVDRLPVVPVPWIGERPVVVLVELRYVAVGPVRDYVLAQHGGALLRDFAVRPSPEEHVYPAVQRRAYHAGLLVEGHVHYAGHVLPPLAVDVNVYEEVVDEFGSLAREVERLQGLARARGLLILDVALYDGYLYPRVVRPDRDLHHGAGEYAEVRQPVGRVYHLRVVLQRDVGARVLVGHVVRHVEGAPGRHAHRWHVPRKGGEPPDRALVECGGYVQFGDAVLYVEQDHPSYVEHDRDNLCERGCRGELAPLRLVNVLYVGHDVRIEFGERKPVFLEYPEFVCHADVDLQFEYLSHEG